MLCEAREDLYIQQDRRTRSKVLETPGSLEGECFIYIHILVLDTVFCDRMFSASLLSLSEQLHEAVKVFPNRNPLND